MKAKTVGDIVRGRPVYVVRESDSVLDAARYMTEYEVGAVPVLAESELVGVFSERDLTTRVVAQELDPAQTKVGEVMTREVPVLAEDSTCEATLATMRQLGVSHLPVTAGKRLVGCVSIGALLSVKPGPADATTGFVGSPIDKGKRSHRAD